MKEKTTKKAMLHNYTCISVPYCTLQSMLVYRSPDYYTSGVYGWNADCYIFGNYAIVMGYRPFGIKADSSICTKYDSKAEKMLLDMRQNTCAEVDDVLYTICMEFIEEVCVK